MVSIIVAMTTDRVIGRANQLPWSLPQDLRNFKRLTSGNVVIMGRKTYESIGRALPNRQNIIVSRRPQEIPNAEVCVDVSQAITKSMEYGREIFVIGGAQIYESALPYATKLYISWVKEKHAGDVFFPEFDLAGWAEQQREDYPEFTFVVYVRSGTRPSSM